MEDIRARLPKNRAYELVKKFDLGAGQWGDNILSNLSQPNSDEVDTESTTDDVMIERLKKEINSSGGTTRI
ncbi:MAG: hypothetical protein Ct9H90mP16_06940 [Candidatus Poseidoniales archaeon]|nr:MAG: hypothetical protein Ct9H90mP16_06940 [Candidatus Poseidoniales archaeon]